MSEVVVVESTSGPLGIPEAKHILNVKSFVGSREPAQVLIPLRELYSKYLFLEQSLKQQLLKLHSQLPTLKEPLNAVESLIQRQAAGKTEEEAMYYPLSDCCYAQAVVPPTNVVYLWLGANTLCEFTLEEAKESLSKTLKSAGSRIEKLESDIEFLRRQMTITEVNMSRVQNMSACAARGLVA